MLIWLKKEIIYRIKLEYKYLQDFFYNVEVTKRLRLDLCNKNSFNWNSFWQDPATAVGQNLLPSDREQGLFRWRIVRRRAKADEHVHEHVKLNPKSTLVKGITGLPDFFLISITRLFVKHFLLILIWQYLIPFSRELKALAYSPPPSMQWNKLIQPLDLSQQAD